MNNKLIEAIVTSKVTADIGKYVKDGVDLDYDIVMPKYDEYTGVEQADTESHSVVLVGLDQQIADAKAVLANLEALKVILTDKDVPVIADYTAKPVEEPPIVDPEPIEGGV
jgi:hypothetical protein